MLIVTLVFSSVTFASPANSDIQVTVHGELVVFPDAQPFKDAAGRIQVPIRFLAEALGADVKWEGAASKVSFASSGEAGDRNLSLFVGQDWYRSQGHYYTMDTSAVHREGRVFGPVRFISEAFGAEVGWDNDTQTVMLQQQSEADSVSETETLDFVFHPGTGTEPMFISDQYDGDQLARALVPYAEQFYKIVGDYIADLDHNTDAFEAFIGTHLPERVFAIIGARDAARNGLRNLKRNLNPPDLKYLQDNVRQLTSPQTPLSWDYSLVGGGYFDGGIRLHYYRLVKTPMSTMRFKVSFLFAPDPEHAGYLILEGVDATSYSAGKYYNPLTQDAEGKPLLAKVVAGTKSSPMLIAKGYDDHALCAAMNPYASEAYKLYGHYLADAKDDMVDIEAFLDQHHSVKDGSNQDLSSWGFSISKPSVEKFYGSESASAMPIFVERMTQQDEMFVCGLNKRDKGGFDYFDIYFPLEVVIDHKPYQFRLSFRFDTYPKDDDYYMLKFMEIGRM